MRICEYCGKEFEDSDKVYCSTKCLNEARHFDFQNKICKKCGKPIEHGNNCDHEILISPEQMEYLKKIGLEENTAKNVKNLRDSLTHGDKDITNSELKVILYIIIKAIIFWCWKIEKMWDSLGSSWNFKRNC